MKNVQNQGKFSFTTVGKLCLPLHRFSRDLRLLKPNPTLKFTQIGLEMWKLRPQTDFRPSVQYGRYSADFHETLACSATFCSEILRRIS